jgi:hypothetical protein
MEMKLNLKVLALCICWTVFEKGDQNLLERNLNTPAVSQNLLWETSMGTSHRLPIPVSKQQLDKHNYRGNQQS